MSLCSSFSFVSQMPSATCTISLPERTRSSGAGACDQSWRAKGDDAVLLQEAGGAEGKCSLGAQELGCSSRAQAVSLTASLSSLPQKLEEEDDDSFLNAAWADNHALKRQFHGVKDIKWGPRWSSANPFLSCLVDALVCSKELCAVDSSDSRWNCHFCGLRCSIKVPISLSLQQHFSLQRNGQILLMSGILLETCNLDMEMSICFIDKRSSKCALECLVLFRVVFILCPHSCITIRLWALEKIIYFIGNQFPPTNPGRIKVFYVLVHVST